MNISQRDLKILWAKSAGRCAFPRCNENCIVAFEESGDTILGEMAHVIAQSTSGPRGMTGSPGPDTYENLVLLCPTHHRTVDKAPDDFPPETLLGWKQTIEDRVANIMEGPSFSSRAGLYQFAARILAENRTVHRRFGPESPQALANPLTEGSALWTLRKLSTVVPNNQKIVSAFEQNQSLVPLADWEVFLDFREHAVAFERNTIERMDRDMVPRFPVPFEEMLRSV